MTNVRFDSIDDYQDIESLNLYYERTAAGVPHERMMEGIGTNGRDNARTPMQWNNESMPVSALPTMAESEPKLH